MQLATDVMSAAPVATSAAVVPHYLYKLLTPMHATRALHLYPFQNLNDYAGQGILTDIKRKPLSGDFGDETSPEIKDVLQRAVDFIAERQKTIPLEQRDYFREVRRGLPESITAHFVGSIPSNVQEGLVARDYSQTRNKVSDDLAWLRTLQAQAALDSLRQDVTSFFAQREMQKQAKLTDNAPSSLSSLMNATGNTLRSAAAGLASLFKQGADATPEKKDTPESAPPLGLPHQQPDIVPPQMGDQIKQPVPRGKNSAGPQ